MSAEFRIGEPESNRRALTRLLRSYLADAASSTRIVLTHPSNHGKIVRQVVNAGWHQIQRRALHRSIQVPLGSHGGRIWAEPDHPGGGYVLYANPPDWPHMLVWQQRLQPGDLFVDVGANIGTYSIFCLSLGADVVAIEPAPETLPYLYRNNDLNNERIEVIAAAAGDRPGVVSFTSGHNEQNRIDSSGDQTVDVVTLDCVIGERTVAGLKVDVEGHELQALQGASDALRDHRIRLLQIEWNALAERGPVEELLRGSGYALYRPTTKGGLVPFLPQGPGTDLFAAVPSMIDEPGPRLVGARRRRRVALFTSFPPTIGGGAAQLRSVLPELNDLDVQWYYLGHQAAPTGSGTRIGGPLPMPAFVGDLCARACGRPHGSGAVASLVEQMDADVFWVVAHNEGVLVAAELLALGKQVHLSVHDDPAVVFGRSRKYRAFSPVVRSVFRNLLREATTVDVIGSGMQRCYEYEYRCPSAILYRFASALPQVPDAGDPAERGFRVGHIGQLYDSNPFRVFLRACRRYVEGRGWALKIVTIGTSSHLETIQAECPGIFEPHGQMDEAAAIQVLSSCDLVYSMYPHGERLRRFRQTSVPMKLSTYILAQRPIFAHAPIDSTLAEIVKRYKIGSVCGKYDLPAVERSLSTLVESGVASTAFEQARTGLLGYDQVANLRSSLEYRPDADQARQVVTPVGSVGTG